MKFHRCIWACCTAILLLGSVAVLDAHAYGRRGGYYSPGVTYYYSPGPVGAGAALPYFGPGVNYGWTIPTYAYPYNPYIAPYPAYGILPPPFASANPYAGTQRTAEDYGYSFDTAPRKRAATYPAVPFENAPVDRLADLRRVTFAINVPKEDAVVLFDGAETKQTGLKRTFRTPPMKEDVLFTSTIEVRWTDEAGKQQMRKEERKFVAGESVTVTIK